MFLFRVDVFHQCAKPALALERAAEVAVATSVVGARPPGVAKHSATTAVSLPVFFCGWFPFFWF